jgi:hypothetical protein
MTLRELGSSPEEGSSKNKSCESPTEAQARQAFRLLPPESSLAFLFLSSLIPHFMIISLTVLLIISRGIPLRLA